MSLVHLTPYSPSTTHQQLPRTRAQDNGLGLYSQEQLKEEYEQEEEQGEESTALTEEKLKEEVSCTSTLHLPTPSPTVTPSTLPRC